MWNSDKWERQKNCFLQIPAGRTPAAMFETQLQYHKDQIHFLVIHETQLAVYETSKLECEKQVISFQHTLFSVDHLALEQFSFVP